MPPQNQSFQTTALPNLQTQSFATHQQQQHQQPVRSNPTPEPVKQKPPLPEEYMYLQTVFNELRNQCINTATNPVCLFHNTTKYS